MRRLLPDKDRLRSVARLVLMIPGLLVLGWSGWDIGTSPGAIRSYSTTTIVPVAGAALTILGAGFAFFPRFVLEIDVESRT